MVTNPLFIRFFTFIYWYIIRNYVMIFHIVINIFIVINIKMFSMSETWKLSRSFDSFGNIFIAFHISILVVWFKRISLNNSIKFDILSPYSTFLFLFLVKKVFYHVFLYLCADNYKDLEWNILPSYCRFFHCWQWLVLIKKYRRASCKGYWYDSNVGNTGTAMFTTLHDRIPYS